VGFFFLFFWRTEKTSDKSFNLCLHVSVKTAVGSFCPHDVYSDNVIQGTSCVNMEPYLSNWSKNLLKRLFTGKSRGTQFNFCLLCFRGQLLSRWAFTVPFSSEGKSRQTQKM